MAWDYTKEEDLIEAAWVIIANAGKSSWEDSSEWTGAAEEWRNGYHAWIAQNRPDDLGLMEEPKDG